MCLWGRSAPSQGGRVVSGLGLTLCSEGCPEALILPHLSCAVSEGMPLQEPGQGVPAECCLSQCPVLPRHGASLTASTQLSTAAPVLWAPVWHSQVRGSRAGVPWRGSRLQPGVLSLRTGFCPSQFWDMHMYCRFCVILLANLLSGVISGNSEVSSRSLLLVT